MGKTKLNLTETRGAKKSKRGLPILHTASGATCIREASLRRGSSSKKEKGADSGQPEKTEWTKREVVDQLIERFSGKPPVQKSSLPQLWSQLHHDARHHTMMCVAYCTGWLSDSLVFETKKQRFTPNLKAVRSQINLLKKTLEKTRTFKSLSDANHGRLYDLASSVKGKADLVTVIEQEVDWLEALEMRLSQAMDEKRLGVTAPLYHLVVAQDFIEEWGRTIGKQLVLRPADLAELILFARAERGWKREDSNLADNLGKALVRFRRNPKNVFVVEGLRSLANRQVASSQTLSVKQ